MAVLSENTQAQSTKETLQQTIDRVLLDGKVSKEELTELASKYETGKKDATDATKTRCAALLKESVTGMLKEYTLVDVADQRKLESLIKTADLPFTVGAIDFKNGPVKVKLDGTVIRPLRSLEGVFTTKDEYALNMKSLLAFRQFSKIEAGDFIDQTLRIFRNKEELQGYMNALDGKIDQTSKDNLLQYIDDMLSEGIGNERHLEALKSKIQALRLMHADVPLVSNIAPSAVVEIHPVEAPVTAPVPTPTTNGEIAKDKAADTLSKVVLLAAISKDIITSCHTGKEYNKHPETVKALQKLLAAEGYAVSETGVYDKDTRAAVHTLQTMLQEKGFYVNKIDGAFGGATYAAYEDFIKGEKPRKIKVAAKDCPPAESKKWEKKANKIDKSSSVAKAPKKHKISKDHKAVPKVEAKAAKKETKEKLPTPEKIRSRIKPEANVRLGIVKDFGNGNYELDISYIASTLGHEYSMITKVETKITAQELKNGKTWKDMDFRPLLMGTDNKYIPGFGHAYDIVLGKNGSLRLVEPALNIPLAKPTPIKQEKTPPVQPAKQTSVPSAAKAPAPVATPSLVRKAPVIASTSRVPAKPPVAPAVSPAQKEAADKAAAIEKQKLDKIDIYLVSQGFTKTKDGSYLNHDENLSLTIENGKVEQDKLGWRNFGVLNDQEELIMKNVQNLLEGKAIETAKKPSTKPTAIKSAPDVISPVPAKPSLHEYDATKTQPQEQSTNSPFGIPGKINDALNGKTPTEKPSTNPLD